MSRAWSALGPARDPEDAGEGFSTERMKKPRKHYSEEKVAILRRRLLEKEPISKLCDELGLQPTDVRDDVRGQGVG